MPSAPRFGLVFVGEMPEPDLGPRRGFRTYARHLAPQVYHRIGVRGTSQSTGGRGFKSPQLHQTPWSERFAGRLWLARFTILRSRAPQAAHNTPASKHLSFCEVPRVMSGCTRRLTRLPGFGVVGLRRRLVLMDHVPPNETVKASPPTDEAGVTTRVWASAEKPYGRPTGYRPSAAGSARQARLAACRSPMPAEGSDEAGPVRNARQQPDGVTRRV